jgi:TRAP-type C4-dicarboxylate transport system substrate-binding protein
MNSVNGTKQRFASGAGRMRFAAVLATFLAIPFAIDGAVAQDKVMTVKLATAPLNDAQHEWMKRFAAKIEKASNGRLKAELYPASQLGSIPRMIEGTQLGSIQIFVTAPEFLVGVDQRFEILSAPGLFDDDRHALRVAADPEFSKAYLALGANKGLIGVALFITGPAVFVMRAPARALADLKGKKVRVLASQFQMEQLSRLGATGVPLSLGDVLPALQQGALDGAMGGLAVFGALQYQDTAKYTTETGQAYVFSESVVSKRWFDALPADLQAAVMSTSKAALDEVVPWSLDFLVAQRKTWIEKGGELIALPAADKADMMAKVAPVGDDIVKSKPELKPLWDVLVATAKRTR